MPTCQLMLSWSESICSASGHSSMSLVSAPFWHAAGTERPLRPELSARCWALVNCQGHSGCLQVRDCGCGPRLLYFAAVLADCIIGRWTSTAS
jgi:hypothetical protein